MQAQPVQPVQQQGAYYDEPQSGSAASKIAPSTPVKKRVIREYDADGKEKKATEQYELALKYINGDDILTQQIANEFSNANKQDWAIKAYERATQVTQVPGIYNAALAKLYNQIGNTEKAISLVIEGRQNQMLMNGDESTETTLLQLMGKDVEKQMDSKTIQEAQRYSSICVSSEFKQCADGSFSDFFK
jgi:tetratricopeptide (TPR) repeat protein